MEEDYRNNELDRSDLDHHQPNLAKKKVLLLSSTSRNSAENTTVDDDEDDIETESDHDNDEELEEESNNNGLVPSPPSASTKPDQRKSTTSVDVFLARDSAQSKYRTGPVVFSSAPSSSVTVRNLNTGTLTNGVGKSPSSPNSSHHRNITSRFGSFSPSPPTVQLRDSDSILLTIFIGIVICACIATILLAFITISGIGKGGLLAYCLSHLKPIHIICRSQKVAASV